MWKALSSVLLCLVLASSVLAAETSPAQTLQLPDPTGPYKIGTALFDWVDTSREEAWVAGSTHPRELAVQIRYPADSAKGLKTAPYVFSLERIKASLEQDWPGFPDLQTHALVGAKLSAVQKKYPVLVFSHGLNATRFEHTALLEEIASHGYIVAAIDHSYWGPGVAFPDGRIIPFEEGMEARTKLTSDEIDYMMWAGISVMVTDEAFVEKKLEQLNASPSPSDLFYGRLDLARMGAMGHSMGAMAATRACLEYTAFKACACLDGLDHYFYLRPAASTKPFLLLLNSVWGTQYISPSLAQRYLAAWAAPQVFVVPSTKHNSFADYPILKPTSRATAPSDPVAAERLIAATVLDFFDRAFGDKASGKMELPGLVDVDLTQIASSAPAAADPQPQH